VLIRTANAFACTLCEHTPSEPWPPFSVENPNVKPKSELEIIRESLRCFHTRVLFTEDILGVGLVVKRRRNGVIHAISTPLELMTKHAFDEGIRSSVYGSTEKLTHWLPLYINKDHGKRSQDMLKQALSKLCCKDRFTPSMAFKIFPKLMNTMIVEIMNGTLYASIKALEGYCAFQRYMISFAAKHPQQVEQINNKIIKFRVSVENRSKAVLPSLGEFLPLLTISSLAWKDIAVPYMREAFIRNVRWYTKECYQLAAQEPLPAVENIRASKTFELTKVSRHLLAFHVYFLENIGRPAGLSAQKIANNYDARYGRPTEDMIGGLRDAVETIKNISTWDEFFIYVRLKPPTHGELNNWLRRSVIESYRLGYHRAVHGRALVVPVTKRKNGGTPRQGNYNNNGHNNAQRNGNQNRYTQSLNSGRGRGRGREICKFYRDSGGKHCPHRHCQFSHDLGGGVGRGYNSRPGRGYK